MRENLYGGAGRALRDSFRLLSRSWGAQLMHRPV